MWTQAQKRAKYKYDAANTVQFKMKLNKNTDADILQKLEEGEEISNSEARRMKGSKTYIDIKTGKVYSDNAYLMEAADKPVAHTLRNEERIQKITEGIREAEAREAYERSLG